MQVFITLLKTPTQVFSCEYDENFKNNYLKNIFERMLLIDDTIIMLEWSILISLIWW